MICEAKQVLAPCVALSLRCARDASGFEEQIIYVLPSSTAINK